MTVSGTTFLASIICAIFASTGFWAFLTYIIQRKDKKDTPETKMIRGLGHDRICYLGANYVRQGYITRDDYENLYEYLYKPYKDLGGNGTAERMMKEVDKLPMRQRKEEAKDGIHQQSLNKYNLN